MHRCFAPLYRSNFKSNRECRSYSLRDIKESFICRGLQEAYQKLVSLLLNGDWNLDTFLVLVEVLDS